MQKRTLREGFALVATAVLMSACATAHPPLTIEAQGSFAIGGTVISRDADAPRVARSR